jgi:hypothetical protein
MQHGAKIMFRLFLDTEKMRNRLNWFQRFLIPIRIYDQNSLNKNMIIYNKGLIWVLMVEIKRDFDRVGFCAVKYLNV